MVGHFPRPRLYAMSACSIADIAASSSKQGILPKYVGKLLSFLMEEYTSDVSPFHSFNSPPTRYLVILIFSGTFILYNDLLK